MSAEDDAEVAVLDVGSAIVVEKTASISIVMTYSEPVTFTVSVRNISAADAVTITQVTDDIYGDISAGCLPALPALIAVNETIDCSFTRLIAGINGDVHHNTVTAMGTDDDGIPLTASDDATVNIIIVDYGDLPDIYSTMIGSNGAGHVIDPAMELMLGVDVDADFDGDPSDDSIADADDGVVFKTAPTVGKPAEADVTISNRSGRDAFVYGYVDLNGDGDFSDPGEVVSATIPSREAPQTVTMIFGNIDTEGQLYARFRVSTNREAVSSPFGIAPDGEVEV